MIVTTQGIRLFFVSLLSKEQMKRNKNPEKKTNHHDKKIIVYCHSTAVCR